MTTRSKLMLMAAALAPLPLYAQQTDTPPAPVPAAVVPADQAPAPAADRLSVLSYIPADVDGAMFINIDKGYRNANMSMAFGAAKGDAATLAALYKLFAIAPAIEMTEDIAKEWTSVAKEPLRPVIKDFAEALVKQYLEQGVALAQGAKLHPCYGVIRIDNRDTDAIDNLYAELIEGMDYEVKHSDNTERVTIGKLTGIKLTAPDDFEETHLTSQQTIVGPVDPEAVTGEEEEGVVADADEADEGCVVYNEPVKYTHEPDPAEIFAVKGVAHRSFYVLIGKEGKHIFGVVCEDPAEIAFPEKPEASVAATAEWQVVQPNKDGLVFGLSLNPEMNNAGYAQALGFVEWAGTAADLFGKMAGEDAESAETFKAAAAGIKTIVAQAHGLMPPAESPLFCQVWHTPDARTYHAELTCDAMGHTFAPAKLALADKAADPDTVFCLETTPLDVGTRYTSPGLAAVGQAGMDVFNGVVATLTPELQMLVSEGTKEFMHFLPEVAGACTAIGTMMDGVGGATGIYVDGKGTAPKYLVGGGDAAMFRIALRTGVKDREKLAQGWDMLIQTAGDVVEKIGQDRAMLAMLPIIPAQIANETISYNVAIPGILTPDMGANVTLNNSVFVAGSSSKLNQELVSTTGTQEFAGTTFVLNFKPLAATARSIADAMLAAAGPIELSGEYREVDDEGYIIHYNTMPVNRADLEAAGWDGRIGYHGEKPLIVKDDKGIERDIRWVNERPSDAQRPAFEARDRAEMLESYAKDVLQIKGDITIKDDIETIRVDVILNPDKD